MRWGGEPCAAWWRGNYLRPSTPPPSNLRSMVPLPSLRPGRNSGQRQQAPRRGFVRPHTLDQRRHVGELLLLADEGVQRDLDPAAVKVALEPEQMRLEQLLRRLERRPDAEAGDARMLAPVVERHPHRIDAVFRPLVVRER